MRLDCYNIPLAQEGGGFQQRSMLADGFRLPPPTATEEGDCTDDCSSSPAHYH